MPVDPGLRVGQGFDVHRYSTDPSKPLVLGGVTFAGERGLHGHSDADVVAHAVIEAILGAAGLADIGEMFPDDDPELEGADSIELLRRAVDAAVAEGWTPVNVDCAVVVDTPKLSLHKAEMRRILSEAIQAPVSIKARHSEGVGAIGRGEGIAAWAVALVAR